MFPSLLLGPIHPDRRLEMKKIPSFEEETVSETG